MAPVRDAAAGRAPRTIAVAVATAFAAVVLLVASPAQAVEPDSSATPSVLGAASTVAQTPAAAETPALANAAADAPRSSGFTVRRVPNPSYRAPMPVPAVLPSIATPAHALDRLRGRVAHRGMGQTARSTEWEVGAGEEIYGGPRFELTASGASDARSSGLRAMRLSGFAGDWSGDLGDAPPLSFGPIATLNRLRGANVLLAPRNGPAWRMVGGVPTPTPNAPTRELALGGLSLDRAQLDDAQLSFLLLGFSRGESPRYLGAPIDVDSLASHGGGAQLGWRAPLFAGLLSGTLGAQVQSEPGAIRAAAMQALEWNWITRSAVVLLRDERNTPNASVYGTERFAPAPRTSDQWNVQSRFLGGRAESHFAGALRSDVDPTLATRTLIVGASGNLGNSPWYGGIEATWDRRELTGDEARQWLHAGYVSSMGHALTARLERNETTGRSALTTVAADGSFSLGRGRRIDLEPRLSWDSAQLRDAEGTMRWSLPLARSSARFGGALSLGGTRDERFRGVLHEASVSLSWQPGGRDLGELEVRRLDSGGGPSLEAIAGYETSFQRREGQPLLAARDSGRVIVRVLQNGDRAPIANALISLDGRDLRFTDDQGFARFDGVGPGVHVVSIEERSLPRSYQVLDGSRVFIAVQRGVPTPAILFRVERSERKTRF